MMVVFSLTKSKQAGNVVGSIVPGGKYTKISNYLSDTDVLEKVTCAGGDVVWMFDNEQVVGRSWNIQADNKVTASVMTNVAVANIYPNTALQGKENLMPGRWLTTKDNEDEVVNLCKEIDKSHFDTLTDDHYEELCRELEFSNEVVSNELKLIKWRKIH